MDFLKANLQYLHNRLEILWVRLVPTVFRRDFRSICVGFLPLETSPGGFCFNVTFRVRFPKPPWNLFFTKILPGIDYCEPVSITASGDTNRNSLTTHHVLNFTGIEPGECFWVGHGVWSFQDQRCDKPERQEVKIRKNVMSRLIPTSISTVGSVMASWTLMEGDVSGPVGVFIPASGTAFVLSSTVYISWNVSGDHVNPVIPATMAVAGRFSVLTAILYWSAPIVALFLVCFVLKVNVVEQNVSIYQFAGDMMGFGALVLESVFAFVQDYIVFTAALVSLEVCLQNGQMRILAHWLGIYEYKEPTEALVANEQICIRRFNSHGLEPFHTTYNNFLLITVMRKAFRSFIYKMIAFYKYMKRGLNRFYLLPVRLLLETRVTSTSSSKLDFNFLYLFQWLYLNGFMYHVSCKTFMN